MKLSLAIAAAILLTAAIIGRSLDRQGQKQQQERVWKTAALAELEAPGTAVKPLVNPSKDPQGEEETIKNLCKEFFDLAREAVAAKRGTEGMNAELQQRIVSIMGRILAMNTPQLKIAIRESFNMVDADDAVRQDTLELLLTHLGKTDPVEALSLWRKSADGFSDQPRVRRFINATLANWSRMRPHDAMRWVQTHGGEFPDLVNDDVKRGMLASVAAADPALAFNMVGPLNLQDRAQAAAAIAGTATSPESRIGVLKALRNFVADAPSPSETNKILESAMPQLARGVSKDGFAESKAWMESHQLAGDELTSFISGIPLSAEEGKWIDWMEMNVSPDKLDAIIGQRIAKWTAEDHQAVGEWLNSTSKGPGRQAAISAFAETVAAYEPESAEQWALSLPAGARQLEALQKIRANWPAKDSTGTEAAAAFAKRHGLE